MKIYINGGSDNDKQYTDCMEVLSLYKYIYHCLYIIAIITAHTSDEYLLYGKLANLN